MNAAASMQVRQRCFWFNEPHDRPLPLRPIVVDGFAGGGGASVGLSRAIGRDVDVAINHDKEAIAMHMANHPLTKHYCENIWDVDPAEVCEGRPVDVAWFSPDCTHHSKARGTKPVKKNIRGLAWVVVKWAELVKPRVMFIENVEEFEEWGPVDRATKKPIKAKAGVTFELWVWKLRELGYEVEWRVLRASDYGTPTTRKRLFIIARCDGRPIVWPEPTHGSPKEIARQLKQRGVCRLRTWRTAAEIIDWSIPCPSIFDTEAEIKRRYGVKAIRPLADKTLRRIAEGIRRYVIEAADPFIVRVNHGGEHFRGQTSDAPLATVTAHHGYGVIDPVLAPCITGCGGRAGQSSPCSPASPLTTLTAKADRVLVAPTLIQMGYGEHDGQPARVLDLAKPLGTVVAGGNKFGLVSAFIAKHFGGVVGVDARVPVPTLTARPTQNQIVTAHVTKMNYGVKPCTAADEPLHTIIAGGQTHALTTSHLMKLYGTCRHGQRTDEPVPTITANGYKVAEVRAFLMRYYTSGGRWSACDAPLATITTKARLCLGIVMVGGEPWQIVDIGMRMLIPSELFRAMGFPSTYSIDVGVNGKPATKTAQVARCGNSVCPQVVEAIVRANAA